MVGVSGGGFIEEVRIEPEPDAAGYPYSMPVVAGLVGGAGLALNPGATFLVGENGSGKSTLIEAIAMAAGFNPEGGSPNFHFGTRSSESDLGRYVVLRRGHPNPRTGYFLRAESFYNVATEIEMIGRESGQSLLDSYGGVSLHERSHGESFLALVMNRFGPNGLYVLDEPEAALSVRGCMALIARMIDLVAQNCQFVVATHSPILLALPGATILEIDDEGGIAPTGYDDALPVQITREFCAAPDRYLRYLR